MCGAASASALKTAFAWGLSPRVWGSQLAIISSPIYMRSIPTCVGQPVEGTRTTLPFRVYPHVCGAAGLDDSVSHICRGLSPRVWGSPVMTTSTKESKGSIPTCVGQPKPAGSAGCAREVYPHVCGAASGHTRRAIAEGGLSPRVWGSQREALAYRTKQRSIPTCVGQPSQRSDEI